MRVSLVYPFLACAVGLAACVTENGDSKPDYARAEICADASGFTKRAQADPAYKTSKVYATDQELAYINRCVSAAGGTAKPWIEPALKTVKSVPGNLAFPHGYPKMSGDMALWPTLTEAQQRRAILFLQSGSTIRSSLQGD